jgi:hypothetical protein
LQSWRPLWRPCWEVRQMDKLTAARQLRRAIEIFAESLQLDDERALEISGLYPAWRVGQNYTAGQIISYGETTGGEPQLWRVLQGHTSQDETGRGSEFVSGGAQIGHRTT